MSLWWSLTTCQPFSWFCRWKSPAECCFQGGCHGWFQANFLSVVRRCRCTYCLVLTTRNKNKFGPSLFLLRLFLILSRVCRLADLCHLSSWLPCRGTERKYRYHGSINPFSTKCFMSCYSEESFYARERSLETFFVLAKLLTFFFL